MHGLFNCIHEYWENSPNEIHLRQSLDTHHEVLESFDLQALSSKGQRTLILCKWLTHNFLMFFCDLACIEKPIAIILDRK